MSVNRLDVGTMKFRRPLEKSATLIPNLAVATLVEIDVFPIGYRFARIFP